MNAPKRQQSTDRMRKEAVARAERNRSYRLHDALLIIALFAGYGMFLFYGRMTPGDGGGP